MGPGVTAGTSDTPVSTRRIFFTVLDWAGLESAHSLRASESAAGSRARRSDEAVPWLRLAASDHGCLWSQKAIFAGTTEVYDLLDDPGEAKNLGAGANLPGRFAQGARRLSRAVAGSRARAREPERRSAPQSRQPRLCERERAAGRPQGCAAAGGHGRVVRDSREGERALRERALCRGHPAAREDPRRRSEQSRRAASARHRALVTRPRGASARGVQGRGGDRAPVAGCPHLSRAALRARKGLAAGRASARARRRRDAGSAAGGRGSCQRARASGQDAGGTRLTAEDRDAASAHGSRYGAHRTAGDAAAADTAGH